MASRKNKVKYIRGGKVPTADMVQPTMIGTAMSPRAGVLNSADMVNPSSVPSINSLGTQSVPMTNTIQPSVLLGTDSVMGMQNALEMQNPAMGDLTLGDTTVIQNGKTRKSRVKRAR